MATVAMEKSTEFQRLVKETTKSVYEAGRRSASTHGTDEYEASERAVMAALLRVMRLAQNDVIARGPEIVYVKPPDRPPAKPRRDKPATIQEEG